MLRDDKQAKAYYQQFLERAQDIEKPTQQLLEMKERAKERLTIYEKGFGKMTRIHRRGR